MKVIKSTAWTFALTAALAAPAGAIELVLQNDLKAHDDGKLLEIEHAASVEVPRSRIHFTVHPGEHKKITRGNVTEFVVTRNYKRFKYKYDVRCSPTAEGSATITILDIHRHHLPDGCSVEREGHWSRRSGMNWRDAGESVREAQRDHRRSNTYDSAATQTMYDDYDSTRLNRYDYGR